MFHVKNKKNASEDCHFFILNEYSFSIKGRDITAEQILIEFLKSNFFFFEHSTAINEPEMHTHGPFIIESLQTTDFRKYLGFRFKQIIDEFINDESWGDDLPDFRKLADATTPIVSQYNIPNDDIYLLNKEWFATSSDKIDAYNVFTYFLTFIVVSISTKRLLLIDYGYD
jgi:hypothetical protein